MHDSDILHGSDIKITKSNNEYKISIPGYKFAFKLDAIFLFVGCAIIIYIMYSIPLNTAGTINCSILLAISAFFTISSHFKTIIYFSKEKIKVRHGLMPFIRKRKTNNVNKICIFFRKGLEGERNETYLKFHFSKEWKISILVTHLSRSERDFLTARLNNLRNKFSQEQE